MVYSEGLLMPLAPACIYYLERKRWLLAGILAGFATAVQPVSVVLIPVCTISALLEWRRRGWRRQPAPGDRGPAAVGARAVCLRDLSVVLDGDAAGQLPGPAPRLEREDRLPGPRPPDDQAGQRVSFTISTSRTINLNLSSG